MKNDFGRMGYGALRSMLMRQQPIMDKLHERYGEMEPEALLEAIFNGSMEAGEPIEECDACRDYAHMLMQAMALKELIPGFDLDAEIADPRFSHLVLTPPHGAGLTLEDAYHALHRRQAEEDMRIRQLQLAGYAAKKTAEKLARAIMSGGMRPAENGMTAAAAAIARTDPATLSREERAEIRRRVNSGEKIHW